MGRIDEEDDGDDDEQSSSRRRVMKMKRRKMDSWTSRAWYEVPTLESLKERVRIPIPSYR